MNASPQRCAFRSSDNNLTSVARDTSLSPLKFSPHEDATNGWKNTEQADDLAPSRQREAFFPKSKQ
jgi:hypothetical protein